MKYTSHNKINEILLKSINNQKTLELLRTSKDKNNDIPFCYVKDWYLLKDFSSTSYKLIFDIIHLLNQVPRDEN